MKPSEKIKIPPGDSKIPKLNLGPIFHPPPIRDFFPHFSIFYYDTSPKTTSQYDFFPHKKMYLNVT